MVFHKVIKNKAYFSRYQVHFRRRREARTDYYARKRLITQDKNKYMTPKPRFIVRFTNTTVICQIAYSEVDGDKIMAAAYSSELPRYGLKVGLKNYSAAYCTGLLCGRRLLAKLGMDKIYEGNTTVNGEVVTSEVVGTQKVKQFYVPNASEERLPFRALLDVGIRTTTTGCRVFGALKGCNDAGVDIPHSPKRFPGYDREAKSYAPEVHRAKIFGEPVADYMRHLADEEPEAYNARFSSYVKAGISADDLEDMYTSVHAAIRADPSGKPKKTQDTHKSWNTPKTGLKQRRNRIAQKKAARIRALTGGN